MKLIIGSDEVGTGAVAGPVYVVAVAMPEDWKLPGLRDSKKMSPKARRDIFPKLLQEVHGHWALATCSPQLIDKMGLFSSLIKAHERALQRLIDRFPDAADVIVDGDLYLPGCPRARGVPKADDKYQVVSAASVLAKVLRDEEMDWWGTKIPAFSFQIHHGYLTDLHRKELRQWDKTSIHRMSFRIRP